MRTSSLAPARRLLLASLLAAAASACAGIRAADARDAYLSSALASYDYPGACIDVWPAVLRLLSARGYSLVGPDRAVAGEPPQGSFAQAMSAGFQTRGTPDGTLTVGTNWNEHWTRYVATGTPAGAGACRVGFTRIWQASNDPATQNSAPDWEMGLGLLEATDPAAAARIESGAPKAK